MPFSFFFFCFFLLDILFIKFQLLYPFLIYPPKSPSHILAPSQDQGPVLSSMSTQQSLQLLHMWLETCVLIGCWFKSLRALGRCLVHTDLLLWDSNSFKILGSFLNLHYWEPCVQSSVCLRASITVYVRYWKRLSEDT